MTERVDETVQPRSPISRVAVVLIALLATVGGLWLGTTMSRAPVDDRVTAVALTAGTMLPEPRKLSPFELIDENGQPLTPQALAEQWTFVSFGYTHCPDVCPTTMATFNAIDQAMVRDGSQRARFLFISVDPERDPPERLAQYVRYFNKEFRGATGGEQALRDLTGQLGVVYARVDDQDTAMGYLVDHSASVLLLDPEVRLAAIFSAPHDPEAMAADFMKVLSYHNR